MGELNMSFGTLLDFLKPNPGPARARRTRRGRSARRPAAARLRLEPLEERAVPAAGDLDLSFHFDGRQTVDFDLGGDNANAAAAVAIDAQGRVVLAGFARVGSNTEDFAVARLNPDGSLDQTFGDQGKQTIAFDLGGDNSDAANAVALDPQGRIVLAGTARVDSNNYDFAVARLNSDGSLDQTFGDNGKRTVAFDLGGSNKDEVNAMAIDAQGRIVLAGFARGGDDTTDDFAVARLNSDGSLDQTFGDNGKRTVAFDLGGFNQDEIKAMAIDALGRIVLAGSADVTILDSDFALARLNSDGSLDTGFGDNGKRTVDIGGGTADAASAVAINAQGQIVVAGRGQFDNSGTLDFAVVRLNSDGNLDPSFSGDGKKTVAFDRGGPNVDVANAVAIDAQGLVVLGGYTTVEVINNDFAVARLNPDGSLDTDFGDHGKRTVAFDLGGANQDNVYAMAIDAQGRIVLAGSVTMGVGNFDDFAVARLIGDDAPPPPAAAGTVGFGATAFSGAEGGGPVTITLVRTGGSAGPLTADLTSTGGGGDFLGVPNSVTFADGQTTATVQVVIVVDSLVEGTETFSLSLSGAGAGSPRTATLQIADNDAEPPPPVLVPIKSPSLPALLVVHYILFTYSARGLNLAVADVTNDGVPDLLIARKGRGPALVVDGATGQMTLVFIIGYHPGFGNGVLLGGLDTDGDGLPNFFVGLSGVRLY
jgi:uncharacterized delta-60 repeat protein